MVDLQDVRGPPVPSISLRYPALLRACHDVTSSHNILIKYATTVVSPDSPWRDLVGGITLFIIWILNRPMAGISKTLSRGRSRESGKSNRWRNFACPDG